MFCLLLPLWIPKSIVVVNPKAWIVWGVWVGMSPLRNPPVEEEVPPCYFSLLILQIKLNLCSDGRLEPKFAQIFVNILVIWIFCSISAEMVWTKSNSRWRASISWEMKMRRRPSSTIRFLGAERKILGTQILARKTNVQIVRAIKEFFFSNLAQSGVSCPDCGEIPDIYGNFGHKMFIYTNCYLDNFRRRRPLTRSWGRSRTSSLTTDFKTCKLICLRSIFITLTWVLPQRQKKRLNSRPLNWSARDAFDRSTRVTNQINENTPIFKVWCTMWSQIT